MANKVIMRPKKQDYKFQQMPNDTSKVNAHRHDMNNKTTSNNNVNQGV